MQRHAPAPWHARLGDEDVHHRLRAVAPADDVERPRAVLQVLRHPLRRCDRGAEPEEPAIRRQQRQAREAEGQQLPALGVGDGVQLVDDHGLEAGEIVRRLAVGQQQRQALRRGQQDVRRMLALALAAVLRRVAGPGLGLDRQPHFRDRRFQVARHVYCQSLERRNVECVDAGTLFLGIGLGQLHQAGQEPGQGLAAAGGRDQQRRAPVLDRRAAPPADGHAPASRGPGTRRRSGAAAGWSAQSGPCRACGTKPDHHRLKPWQHNEIESLGISMALHPQHWLKAMPGGLYCEPGGFFIDPSRPVDRAIVTHGHGDHARSGHGKVAATAETLAIMGVRYGEGFARETQALAYGERLTHGRRHHHAGAGRPHPRQRAGGAGAWRLPRRRLRRLQAALRSDLPALHAGEVRRLHHRGDLRPAGVPSSAGQGRDRQGAACARIVPRPHAC